MELKFFPRFQVNTRIILRNEEVSLGEKFESGIRSDDILKLFHFTGIHPTDEILRFHSSIEIRNKETADCLRDHLPVQTIIRLNLDKQRNFNDCFHKIKRLKLITKKYIEKSHFVFTKYLQKEFRRTKEPRFTLSWVQKLIKSYYV